MTRSTIHDFVRNELAIEAPLRNKIISYLDGEIDVYGKVNTAPSPHENVSRSASVACVNGEASTLWYDWLSKAEYVAEYGKYCKFIDNIKNWQKPSKVRVEVPVARKPAFTEVPQLTRKEVQKILKANDVKYGGRSNTDTLIELAIEHNLLNVPD